MVLTSTTRCFFFFFYLNVHNLLVFHMNQMSTSLVIQNCLNSRLFSPSNSWVLLPNLQPKKQTCKKCVHYLLSWFGQLRAPVLFNCVPNTTKKHDDTRTKAHPRNHGFRSQTRRKLAWPSGCFDNIARALRTRLGFQTTLYSTGQRLKPNPKLKPWFRKGLKVEVSDSWNNSPLFLRETRAVLKSKKQNQVNK